MSRPVTLRLPEETLAALDQLAKRTGRSRNWLVVRALEDFAEISEWQLPAIEAGIDAANRGDFATDEEMDRIWSKYRRHSRSR